jgi:UDP-N-acetylmuramyl tripeptide synthase
MAVNASGAAGARPARASRASLARAPLRARPAAAAAAAVPRANRRAGIAASPSGSGASRAARTRRGVVAAAATSAGREDDDEDVDDDELAALEALDEVDGWGDEDDDDEAMATAMAVAARAVGGDLDDDGALNELEDLEDLEEEAEDEEGVALLRELFEYGGVDVEEWRHLGEDEDIEVSGIANDSRAVLGGDVFVCCRGTTTDGHDHALDAVAAGAVAVVCDRFIEGLSEDTPQVLVADAKKALPRLAAAFYGNPSASLVTVGITGTNGKTTTTFLVRSILEANDSKCGVIGTTGYVLDDTKLTPHGGVWEPEEDDPTENRECTAPGWLAPYKGKYEVPNTTPDALQCQQLMAGMLDNGATATAMEVSSHALAQGRVECVDFDVAVFTNLTSDHLDFHGTMDAYREAKAELFRGLTDPERQRAVINLDPSPKSPSRDGDESGDESEETSESEFFIAAAGGGDRVPIVTYATHATLSDQADVFVEKAELSLFETLVSIRTPVGNFDAACGLVGEVNVTNIAAAVAVGVALEIPLDVIAAGVEAMEPVPGRMELVDEGQPFPVIVDYAHTPDALRRAIQSVRRTGAANVITVFGCGGDRDASKRAEMGRVADELSDIVFVTNDNPRTEDPYAILDDITSGFRDRVYNLEAIKDEAMFPFLKDMYLIHPNARHETMKLQNACRRYVMVDRWFAIRGAIAMATPDDAVLICGKGHEDYIVVGNKKHWFDDRAEARDALRKIVTVQESGVDTTNLPWGRVGAIAGNGNMLDA